MIYFLNGIGKAGCHKSDCFSTYHSIDIENNTCKWCGKTVKELINLGAKWIDVFGNEQK